ncbi:MAG: transposase [Desulfovibrionaceae bacterium]
MSMYHDPNPCAGQAEMPGPGASVPPLGAPWAGGGPCAAGQGGSAEALERDEQAARRHLLSRVWPTGEPECPRCRHTRIYTLAGGRLRCSNCRYTFQPFSGRWLNNGALTSSQWIRLTRMFVEERSPHHIKDVLGLSYNTVYKGLTSLRFAILAHASDARQLLSPATGLDSYLKGARLTGTPANLRMDSIPVYGVLRRGDMVFIDLLPGFQAETIFHFHMSFHLKVERAGNLVYTDRYRDYDAMVLCGNDSLPYGVLRRSEGRPYVDEHEDAFWTDAMRRLKRFRGISCQRFPLYLKELEFRFNTRSADRVSLLLGYLCDLVPELDESDALGC